MSAAACIGSVLAVGVFVEASVGVHDARREEIVRLLQSGLIRRCSVDARVIPDLPESCAARLDHACRADLGRLELGNAAILVSLVGSPSLTRVTAEVVGVPGHDEERVQRVDLQQSVPSWEPALAGLIERLMTPSTGRDDANPLVESAALGPADGGLEGPLILGAVGASVLVLGTVMGLVSLSTRADIESMPRSGADLDGLEASYRREAALGNIGIIGGAAALLGAGLWWLSED